MEDKNVNTKKWYEIEMERLLADTPQAPAKPMPQQQEVLDQIPQGPEATDFNPRPPRQLDMKRLLRESRSSGRVNLVMLTNDLQLKWQELYYRAYEQIYPVSGRERGTLRNLAKKYLRSTISAGMVAMFWDFLKDDWHKSRYMTPSLLAFLCQFDNKWGAKGLAIQAHLNLGSKDYWFVINEAGIDLNLLAGEQETVFKTTQVEGAIRLYVIRNQVLVVKSLKN